MAFISKYKQSFGTMSKEYKKYRGTYTDELFQILLSLVKNGSGEKISILDLGCGVGNSTEPMFRMIKKMKVGDVGVVGCDPDLLMLTEANKSAKKNKLPITYVVGSAEKLPFEKRTFELVFSGAAFHWFATKKAMKEIQRVMKKGSIYAVFWTQNIKSDKPVIGGELYKKYKWQGIPKKLRDPKYVQGLFEKGVFMNVQTLSLPYVQEKTIAESIGLIQTNSSYALLSPQDKKEFITEMTQQYRKALGKNKEILNQEIHICYGYAE